MSTIKAKDLALALRRKGFHLEQGSRHEQYYFYYEGQKTAVRVSVSRGSGSEYSGKLLGYVIREMHLNRNQFKDFVQCPMTEETYISNLQNVGIL